MGKYMKKSKIAGEVAVMEVSPQASLGVRTRAKTLDLQRLRNPSSSPIDPPNLLDASSFSYLQLRSRRLEKPSLQKHNQNPEQPKNCVGQRGKLNNFGGDSRFRVSSEKLVSDGPESKHGKGKEGAFWWDIGNRNETEQDSDMGTEASFGENVLEAEVRDRTTRESTPCSLIRDSDAIKTPGSTTRRRMSTITNQISHEHMQRNIPAAHEIEEFFACAEKQQQQTFIEKYNFDIVNDVPLPGQYEWVETLAGNSLFHWGSMSSNFSVDVKLNV